MGYPESIEAKILDLSNKADKAAWALAWACTNTKNRTKKEMVEAMTEASSLLLEIRKTLTGN